MSASVGCYTVGHSLHSVEFFVEMLERYGIDAVVDVRSRPFSRMAPQFNLEPFSAFLKKRGKYYMNFGASLGARHTDSALLFDDGLVDFEKVMATDSFCKSIDRIVEGLEKGYRIALMCSEKEPFDCHRFVLVSRALTLRKVVVSHIVPEGLVSQAELETRLLEKYKLTSCNLFESRDEILARAYRLRNRDIAFEACAVEGEER